MPRGRGTRALVAVTAALAAIVVGGVPAPAQAPPALPVISMGTPYGPTRLAAVDCDGVRHVINFYEGAAVLNRDDVGPTDPADVEVGVSFSGELADDVIDPPSSITVPSDDRYTAVTFVLPPEALGGITVTLEPGPGYTLGVPSSGSVEVTEQASHTLADCTEPLDLPAGVADQTIPVGGRPADLPPPEGELVYDVVGPVPPGLTFEQGRWSGAATTPGTSVLGVGHCLTRQIPEQSSLPGILCFSSADVRITVRAPSAPSSPSARPATPITTAAAFTG